MHQTLKVVQLGTTLMSLSKPKKGLSAVTVTRKVFSVPDITGGRKSGIPTFSKMLTDLHYLAPASWLTFKCWWSTFSGCSIILRSHWLDEEAGRRSGAHLSPARFLSIRCSAELPHDGLCCSRSRSSACFGPDPDGAGIHQPGISSH